MNKIESKDSRIYVPMTSYKANVQHTLSIRSAYDEHPMKPRGNHEAHPTQIWKYVAMLLLVLVMGVGESWGDSYLVGTMNSTAWTCEDEFKFTYTDGIGALDVELPANTSYEFKINDDYNYYSLNGHTFNGRYENLDVYTGNSDMHLNTTEAGVYRFRFWYADSKHWLSVYFPKDRLTKNTYLYFDLREHTNWKAAFTGRFWFKWYDNSSENVVNPGIDCTNAEALEDWVYYVQVPNNDLIGYVQVQRLNPNNLSEEWCVTNLVDANDRTSSKDNSMTTRSGYENYCKSWTPQWTTYCPPMSDVDLEEDGTTLNWGGDGSSGDPYLIPTGSSIKVKATNATKALEDDNMTIYYQFKKAGVEVQAGSATATATITASGTTGTKEAVIVEAYNYYNSTEGTHLASNEIYYEVRTPYTISYNAGTYGNGSRGSETKLKGVNFATPGSAVFTRTGYIQTGWATSDGGAQVCALGGNYTTDAAATLYPVWTERYRVDFVVNGVTTATIYRATGEAFSAKPADNGVMPADPADNTLSSCGANKFVGWSTTDIGGDAVTTAPTDLFSYASAGEISVSADTTYYAVFGDSIPANATKGLSLARTVMWSEDWTGGLAINDGRPTEPTPSGGYKIGSIIGYTFMNGVGGSAGQTHVIGGSDAGGRSPEVIIGKKGSGENGVAGYLYVSGIPKRGAKKLTLSFTKNTNPTLEVDILGDDYYFLVNDVYSKAITYTDKNGGGEKELTIICGGASTFSLYFRASTTSNNVRIDDFVVKVLEDGATNYRTRCPEVEMEAGLVTAGTPVFITSAAGKTVRSQDSIHIVGSRLNKSKTISLVDASGKFALKSKTNTAISTDENGDIDAYGFIYYTPDVGDTEDGLDRLSDITISIAGTVPIEVTLDQEVIGRHLPENFVIAVYKNSKWWALPANHTNGTPAPIEIKVDNESAPTKVLVANDHVYTLYGQHSSYVTSGNGQYVKLAMHGQSNLPLYGTTETNLGKGGNATNVENNIGKTYWWRFEQKSTSVSETTDVKYYMYCPNNNNSNHVRLWTNSGKEKWGQYTYGEDEIRLIPLYAEEIKVSGTEWGKDAIAVEANFGEKSVGKVEATVGATSSGVMSVPAEVGGAYFFDLDGTISFIGHAGERLILDWYNSSDVQVGASWLTIPSIKDAGEATTWSEIESTPTLEDIVVVCNPMAVDGTGAKAKRVVLDGGQVEISAGKELVVAETVRRLTGSGFGATEEEDIAIGSTAGAGLGALVMGSHDGTNKATVNFTTRSSGISGSSASVSQYLGTPFSDATVLSDWYNSWVYGIQYTEHVIGWARVNDGMDPFKGYAVISADGTNHVYWMQGTLVSSEDKSATLVYNGATVANNENLLANSWMAPIQIKAFEASDFGGATGTIYIFNSGSPDDAEASDVEGTPGNYSAFTPGTAAATDVIPAMQSFSIYSTAASQTVSLDYSKLVYDPAVAGLAIQPNRAPERRRVGGEEMEFLKARVAGLNGWADEVKIYSREDFVTEYENGFDGPKMFGESVAPQMYAMTMDGNMAINCVPTMEGTVLGFRKGSGDSEYTFSFEYEGAETLYLNDLKAQTSTLIGAESSYTFTAAADDDEARFIISATPIGQMPTEVERQKSKVERQKIIIHGNLFIIRDGRMYHVMGTEVR